MNPGGSTAPNQQLAQCRVCTNFGTQLVPFVGGTTSFPNAGVPCSLPEAIVTVGGVPVQLDDGLPQHCCLSCIRQIEAAYKLRRMCQESDRKLKEAARVEIKVEPGQERVQQVTVKAELEIYDDGMVGEDSSPTREVTRVEIKVEPDQEEGREPQLVVQKEELDIDDDGKYDEDGNLMDFEDNVSDAEKVYYEKIAMKGFSCCRCKITFDTKDELVGHRDTVHIADKQTKGTVEYRLQCDICYKVVSSAVNLRKHKQRVTEEYRCKVCGVTSVSQKRILHHYRTRHAAGMGICCGCKKYFESPEALKAHSQMVHLPKRGPSMDKYPFVCQVCYAGYATEQRLFTHQSRINNEALNIPCSECGQRFDSPGQLQQHKKNHSKVCKECGQSFTYNYELQLHEKAHRKNRCNLCPVSFTSEEALQAHIEAHRMPNKTYKCLDCGKCFDKGALLNLHSRVHSKPKQLKLKFFSVQ